MNAALIAALTLCAASASAAAPAKDKTASTPAAAADGQPGSDAVPVSDQQPNPGADAGVTPYALKDLDAVIKADQARMEDDLKLTLKQLDAQYEAQKDLESRQLKEKFAFLRKLRDQRADFEREEIKVWRKFAEGLRGVEPAERGTEKVRFDQEALERRNKNNTASVEANKEFMDKQQRERDEFWSKIQEENNATARRQLEHATQWGKPAPKP